ncbi:60S acidic ribosomal protein P2 [Cricetulus griseus]|uniref:Large ribosomal subunit protein P2 n=1 Tax=Cricetulus griseus TaxID=10029 RepID=G3GZV3_CRIGR|nr:60S acidic ribosomal protein P2 [Cricetulus griseus]ERE79635.1 60S acidic ribosomal protein P2-like protein [Cricetulus griseus]
MLFVASYFLATLGGNSSPSTKDILEKILDSVGIEADDDRLNEVIRELNGKNIEDVIAQGVGKLARVRVPAGGAVAVSAAPGSAAPAAISTPAASRGEERPEEGRVQRVS